MKQAKVLSQMELKRVLAMCGASKHAQRNRIAVLFSHYAGLRVGEIASLKWIDIRDKNGGIKTVFYLSAANTKAQEARPVYLNQLLQRELASFQQGMVRMPTLNQPIIASQKRGHFSANSLCQVFGRIYEESGIEGATSHSGRRWFITKLAHAGISPKVIMELAGHKQLTTTQRYIEVNDQLMQQAIEIL